MDVVMTLHVCAKMLCKMWSHDFYDKMLSTKWQQHHMINHLIKFWRKINKIRSVMRIFKFGIL